MEDLVKHVVGQIIKDIIILYWILINLSQSIFKLICYELSLSKNAKTIPIALQTVLVLTVYAKVSILIKYSKKHKLRNLLDIFIF